MSSTESQINNIHKKYKDTIDLSELLDFSDLMDDPDSLGKEISKQPALYVYFANLKRIADYNYSVIVEKFESFKISKLRAVIEHLKVEGVNHPNSKTIDAKFDSLHKGNEFYKTCKEQMQMLKKRKEMADIALKGIEMRESAFKSLSYMISALVKTGNMYPTIPSKSKRERI